MDSPIPGEKPAPDGAGSSSSATLLKRLARVYLKPYWGILTVALVLMAISAATTGALAKLMEPIIDDVFAASDASRLWPVAIAVFFAFLMRGISTYGHTVLMNKVGMRMIADIQRDMFARLIGSDLAYFQSNSSGQLISRMISDTAVLRLAVGDSMTGFGKNLLTLIFLIGVMFYQDWKLTLAAFFVFPSAAFIVAKIGRRLRRVSHDTQIKMGDFSACLNQSFQGARHVKAYGMEEFEKSRINSIIERIFKLTHKAVKVSAAATPMAEVLSGLAIVTIIIYGGFEVMEGQSTPGKLLSFITAFMLAYEPMKRLARLNATFQMGLAAADRVFRLIDMEPQIRNRPDARQLQVKRPQISLRDVHFAYPDGTVALKGVSITVPPGKTVALVGPSGSGKSTILNLIPRFYDVASGSVEIDGVDARAVTLESLRGSMAFVGQEVAVFNESIRDNIRYGSQAATEEDIVAAAKSAAAHDFIMQLPQGYDTVVGEAGVKLSGGQRQRIAIARAMLRNAPILLLDEATSALDTESERLVQEALTRLQKDRTTLVIAHRLSTIRDADLIYVLENGQMLESGTHDALLARNGLYARLYGLMQANPSAAAVPAPSPASGGDQRNG